MERSNRGEVLDPQRSAAVALDREAAWSVAEPFETWWNRHPELHDSRRVAA